MLLHVLYVIHQIITQYGLENLSQQGNQERNLDNYLGGGSVVKS